MGTTIRPELSEKNPYWIERHRYYELKHFCLQYPIWKKAYAALDGLSRRPSDLEVFSKKGEISDPTVRCVEARSYYIERMKTVEQVAIATDAELSSYILKGVTEGWSYEYLSFLGLDEVDGGDVIGWDICYMIEEMDCYWLDFDNHKTTLEDGLECIIIDTMALSKFE